MLGEMVDFVSIVQFTFPVRNNQEWLFHPVQQKMKTYSCVFGADKL